MWSNSVSCCRVFFSGVESICHIHPSEFVQYILFSLDTTYFHHKHKCGAICLLVYMARISTPQFSNCPKKMNIFLPSPVVHQPQIMHSNVSESGQLKKSTFCLFGQMVHVWSFSNMCSKHFKVVFLFIWVSNLDHVHLHIKCDLDTGWHNSRHTIQQHAKSTSSMQHLWLLNAVVLQETQFSTLPWAESRTWWCLSWLLAEQFPLKIMMSDAVHVVSHTCSGGSAGCWKQRKTLSWKK